MEKAEEVYSIILLRYPTQNELGAVDTFEVCKDVRIALVLRRLVYNVAEHVLWLQRQIFCTGSNEESSTNSNCRSGLQDLLERGELD